MSLILLIAATVCEGIAVILGFRWFGTSSNDWAGWIAAGLFLYFCSLLAGGVSWPAPLRRE